MHVQIAAIIDAAKFFYCSVLWLTSAFKELRKEDVNLQTKKCRKKT